MLIDILAKQQLLSVVQRFGEVVHRRDGRLNLRNKLEENTSIIPVIVHPSLATGSFAYL